MQPQALTINDTCKTLSLSRPTIYRLIKAGRLEAFSIGRRRLIRAASVQHLLEQAA